MIDFGKKSDQSSRPDLLSEVSDINGQKGIISPKLQNILELLSNLKKPH